MLSLLGGFALSADGELITVPPSGQRVLAVVALRGGREGRCRLAAALWPDRIRGRAGANLRGSVWRLPRPVRAGLIVTDHELGFDGTWTIDVDLVKRAAEDLRRDCEPDGVPCDMLRGDLLPDWDEEWLVVEREGHHQLRIHVLEGMARRWLALCQPDRAAEVALAAAAAEPLRESAQYLLVSALLDQDNHAAAAAHYAQFAARLADELAVAPSTAFSELVAGRSPRHQTVRRSPP